MGGILIKMAERLLTAGNGRKARMRWKSEWKDCTKHPLPLPLKHEFRCQKGLFKQLLGHYLAMFSFLVR
jgi:hypothetical protein